MRRRIVLLVALLAPVVAWGAPNLTLDTQTLASSLRFDVISFATDHCALQPADLCVDGPGARKLLRFSVAAENTGDEDVFLGDPSDSPSFIYSPCHQHYHFDTFARYELRERGSGVLVKDGHKRAFCVEDTKPVAATVRSCASDVDCGGRGLCDATQHQCRYNCSYQGVQVGWADVYPASLDCQWIDVTDVAPGAYDLCVFLNTAQLLAESSFGDNDGCVPVAVPAPSVASPAPRMKVRAPRAKTKARAGRPLRIAWQTHLKGGNKRVRVQEVWFSRDGGATWELVASDLEAKRRSYRWTVPAQTATDAARIKVVAWSTAGAQAGTGLQRGIGTSAPFRVVP
jgi:hypothetical protein